MRIAIHQPQYMPWLGYFDKIASVDQFVLLDMVQYKKNEWQNRNRIKNAHGCQWLTVPVNYKFPQKICDVEIDNSVDWQKKHLKSLRTNYNKAPFFDSIIGLLDTIFSQHWRTIAELNCYAVREIAKLLNIKTPIITASELGELPDEPNERLIAIAESCNASEYLAGAGGRNYMDFDQFVRAGITVHQQEYAHPLYPQLFGPFRPYLSILDLLFNCGTESRYILLGRP